MIRSGSTAVVTGGASGIGRAIACELVARDVRVIVADIDGGRAEATASAMGTQAVGVRCDVADHVDVLALLDEAENRMGAVDLVFANAGVSVGGRLLDASTAELDWILQVNVKGAWNTASVFGRRWRDDCRSGHLCLTASEHSLGLQHAGIGLYTATKMAVFGMADVLRSELPEGISVSVLCPGLVDTDLHLSKRTGPLPQDSERSLAFAGAVMARGMPAAEVARAAVDGVSRGDFLIVTHPASLPAATRRSEEIAAAFATQAPPAADAGQYAVDTVIAEIAQSRALR